MPNDWEGHPLRKDYPLRGPARERAPRPAFALKSNVRAGTPPSGTNARSAARSSQARSRGRRPVTMSAQPLTPEIVSQEGNAMVLSMGPQHPSTHGVLQVMLEIEGENVIKAEPEIGYLHTGIEKTAENLFWSQAQTVIERMDYLAPESNALCYALAVERLLGITDRDSRTRANHSRAVDGTDAHRVALRVARDARHRSRRDLGILLLLRSAREHSRPARSRGRRADAPELRARRRAQRRSARRLPRQARRADRQVSRTHARPARTAAGQSDLPRPHDRRRHSHARGSHRNGTSPARSLRASGIAYDVRKAFPYSGYETYEFDVPTRTEGDAYARFLVRLDEMEQSIASSSRRANASTFRAP